MAEPLNYRSARVTKPAADPISAAKGPRVAIPIEFDVVIARSQDQAAINAIEYQFNRENVPFFRTHDGPAVDQWIQLLIRPDDRDRASLIATATLQRRQKMTAFKRR